MTRIKLCGLSRVRDVEAANRLRVEYVGFVFTPKSPRRVTAEAAAELKRLLAPGIQAVGVFADEEPESVARLLEGGVIDMAQLHGGEDERYLERLRRLTGRPIVQAFRVAGADSIRRANASDADLVLLDSGAGTGAAFDWTLAQAMERPYFLAGGLDARNVAAAVGLLSPFAVDVSSGIETLGLKDESKMAAFVEAARSKG